MKFLTNLFLMIVTITLCLTVFVVGAVAVHYGMVAGCLLMIAACVACYLLSSEILSA